MGTGIVQGMNFPFKVEQGYAIVLDFETLTGARGKILEMSDRGKRLGHDYTRTNTNQTLNISIFALSNNTGGWSLDSHVF